MALKKHFAASEITLESRIALPSEIVCREILNTLSNKVDTNSDATLNLYYRDIFLAATQKRNLVEERYQYLYGNLGFKDLEEVEALAQKRAAVKE